MILIIEGIEHDSNDEECPECFEDYPLPCPCGGLIHASVKYEDDSGLVHLTCCCDVCGD